MNTRVPFCAVTTLALGKRDVTNVENGIIFVLPCMNFDGRFRSRPGSESHTGQDSWLLLSS